MRMLSPALRRDIGNRAFQNFQQCLLNAFAGNVARDRGVFVFATDLIDFVDIDDAGLGPSYIALGGLQQLQDNVLDVFADVARFGERGGVHNSERDVQHLCQSLGQQGLARAGRTDQKDVGLGQFDAVASPLPVHIDPLVVVVHGDCQLLLGLLLADDVFIQEGLDLLGLGKLVGSLRSGGGSAVVF